MLQEDDNEAEDDQRCSAPLSYPCKIPKFSKIVTKALEQGQIYKEWDQFVREAAIYYISDIPDSSDGLARVSYHAIGRTMFEKYPCIKSNGHTAWVRRHIDKVQNTLGPGKGGGDRFGL